MFQGCGVCVPHCSSTKPQALQLEPAVQLCAGDLDVTVGIMR